MKYFGRLNLQQRFNWLIFITIVFVSCLLIGLMYQLMSKYSNDYTNHYWREHTKTFADSALYSVIIGSTSQSETIVHSFAADNNVLMASIYNAQHELLASSGDAIGCDRSTADFLSSDSTDTADYWCFYSPIYHEKYLGYVELVISKAEYKAVLRNLLSGSVLIILFFSCCIFLIVQRLSRLFTSTLLEMAAVLKKVSQGDRGDRVYFSGSAEIDNMRVTLNEMLSSIELTETELEKSVEDRTSALKIALESSETANIYKDQIMSMVSHEMKTPLHAISGYLQLLAERLPAEPEHDENRLLHSKALLRVNDLNNLIDNILLHAKLEADRYEISFSSINVASLMSACADNAASLLHRNDNRLELDGPDAILLTDGEVLRHVVNNVLSNACKFTLNGHISLSWRVSSTFLVVDVSDTGCGIPVEFHSNIFDAWWQVDMSLGRKYGGHGLGLAITKQFVNRLGGEISVVSNNPQGSIFTIRVPIGLF
ncbi:hypothetical protein A1353_19100 [Methylomonas methanica]|uniref:histidine kinase n=1 Tax=Methylomonas methanica TaxID=421 RepID=A0A177M5B9_METMH|nr:HAMP domain-containing sensor histidine kinase [Methylomonas methanica]OAI00917.1 hypothetical protein A1353_19100 [Methylomonas methanica]